MTTFKTILLVGLLYFLFDSCNGNSNKTENSGNPLNDSKTRNAISIQQDKDSKLPDSIHVIGTILELTPGECGQLCFSGSLKVKLENKIPNYNNECAYIITACLSFEVKPGAKIDVMASKLTGAETECYYLDNTTTVDSKGFPFYKLSESETSKIH